MGANGKFVAQAHAQAPQAERERPLETLHEPHGVLLDELSLAAGVDGFVDEGG